MPAKFGLAQPRQHVPRLELALMVGSGDATDIRLPFRRQHVNDGLDRNDACTWFDRPDRFDAGHARTDKLAFELGTPTLAVGQEPPHFSSGPREKRDLVNWREGRHAVGAVTEVSCRRLGEGREAVNEGRAEDVEIGRPAVVAEVPDDLDAVLTGGGNLTVHR